MDIPRIVLLKLDGRAIAFHYYFAFCGRMYVHRLAFDPDLSRYSPGVVNTLDAIQVAAEEGLTLVEYLGGAERYKADLSDGATRSTRRSEWPRARSAKQLRHYTRRESKPATGCASRRRSVASTSRGSRRRACCSDALRNRGMQ